MVGNNKLGKVVKMRKKAYKILCLLIFSHQLLPHLYIWIFPLKLYLTILLILVFLPYLFRPLYIDPALAVFIALIAALMGASIGGNIFYEIAKRDDYRDYLLGFLYLVFVPNIVTNRKEFVGVMLAFLIGSIVNSAFAVTQYLQIKIGYSLQSYFIAHSTISGFDVSEAIRNYRKSGLLPSTHMFSYALAISIPFALCKFCFVKEVAKRVAYGAASFFLLLGMILSGSRSIILATIVVMLYLFFNLESRYRLAITAFSVSVFLVLALVLTTIFPLRLQGVFPHFGRIIYWGEMSSALEDARLSTWKCGVNVGLANPIFGSGADYQSKARAACGEMILTTDSKVRPPHNQFIGVFAHYGVIAAIVLILAYYSILAEIRIVIRYHIFKNEGVILFCILTSYVINSFFHNRGLINSLDFWFIIGLVFALNRMCKYHKYPT